MVGEFETEDGWYAVIQQIANDLGKKVALQIILMIGGCRIWIPKDEISADSELYDLDTNVKNYLMDTFGGEEISIPTRLYSNSQARKLAKEYLIKGWNHREIAITVGRSDRIVREVARELRQQGLLPPVQHGRSARRRRSSASAGKVGQQDKKGGRA